MAVLTPPLWHTLSVFGILWALTIPQAPMLEMATAAGEPPLILSGRIQTLRGSRQPGPGQLRAPEMAIGQEIVLVLGRIDPVRLGDPFLPAAHLRAPILNRAKSGPRGDFRVSVMGKPTNQPFQVTILLVVPGGYYLNRFDGSGAFASYLLPQRTQQYIELVDDRGALF